MVYAYSYSRRAQNRSSSNTRFPRSSGAGESREKLHSGASEVRASDVGGRRTFTRFRSAPTSKLATLVRMLARTLVLVYNFHSCNNVYIYNNIYMCLMMFIIIISCEHLVLSFFAHYLLDIYLTIIE